MDKFEIEQDYVDDGFDWVHGEITFEDAHFIHRGYDIVIYIAVTLERGNEVDALDEDVYCCIEGYCNEAREKADEIIKTIRELGGYTKIVEYMKSLKGFSGRR